VFEEGMRARRVIQAHALWRQERDSMSIVMSRIRHVARGGARHRLLHQKYATGENGATSLPSLYAANAAHQLFRHAFAAGCSRLERREKMPNQERTTDQRRGETRSVDNRNTTGELRCCHVDCYCDRQTEEEQRIAEERVCRRARYNAETANSCRTVCSLSRRCYEESVRAAVDRRWRCR